MSIPPKCKDEALIDGPLSKEIAKSFRIPDTISDFAVSSHPNSRITIERFSAGSPPLGDREMERITIHRTDFLEVSFVDHQPDAGDDNSDRYTFKLTTPGGQPFLVDGRETGAVEFTIVGNIELDLFLSGMADLRRLRR